ncbi:unnamed protein product [Trichobilharzia regenti]|nr:unnamed protein product [Trichobilharzia regenti]
MAIQGSNVSQRRTTMVGDSDQHVTGHTTFGSTLCPENVSVSSFSGEIFDACRNGDVNLVKCLIETGINVNLNDTSGRKSTPLHFAAGYGRREVVSLLLEHNADVSARDEGGSFSLFYCPFWLRCVTVYNSISYEKKIVLYMEEIAIFVLPIISFRVELSI